MNTNGEGSSMLISVIIPAYNVDAYIRDAIRSVLSQTHETVELIVVNDGSTDGTADTIAEFGADTRVTLVNQSNKGVCAARNVGLARANGRYVAFLDGDDFWYPPKLSLQHDVLSSEPGIVAVGSFMEYVSSRGTRLGTAGQRVGPNQQHLMAAGRLMPFPLSSMLFRRHPLISIGGFDEVFDLMQPAQGEDLDLLVRLAPHGQVGMTPQVLGGYRIRSGSASAEHRIARHRGARFVRARAAARAAGGDITWSTFEATYKPDIRQRYGDFISDSYRAAALHRADGHLLGAMRYGLAALVLGPRYTLTRACRQVRI